MNQLLQETEILQKKFTDYCRTGIDQKFDGISRKRISQYRRLVYNGIANTLKRAYPITVSVLSNQEWKLLVDEFVEKNNNSTPQIWKMPYEFYRFSIDYKWDVQYNKPWLNDLLYFEWIEIEIHTMPDSDIADFNAEIPNDWMNDKIYVNPESKIITMEYPVHLFPVSEAANRKGDYHMLIWRNISNGEVQFAGLGLFYRVLIENLADGDLSLKAILEMLQKEHGIEINNSISEGIQAFLHNLYERGAILGRLIG